MVSAAGAQTILSQTPKNGPVLLVLFAPPAPIARLATLFADAEEVARLAAAAPSHAGHAQ